MGDETFLDHVKNPRNVGLLDDANVVIQAGDPECDDKLIFFIKIEDDVVRDIKFLIEGCETTVATSSIVTELVIRQPLDAVLSISDRSISDALDGLPEEKMHCTAMAASAMHTAVHQYRATPKGEASSSTHSFEHYRIVAQVLNQPLAEVYSSDFDL
ncbi:MAG: iron-sulfur cluster assembly scaffold protein [Desulfuromonadales bacterium]|nr:iron-sulfur cluster assembly scaffold protein [Desulfuromonadales bacterium]